MKRFFLYLIIISLLVLLVSSCKKSARDIYVEAVEEWIGKEILFPDSMMTVTGEMIAPPTADFTIVSYYDSIGCTGCRMKLPFWNEFIKTVDSIRDGRTVTVLMIAASDKRDDLKHLVKFNHFSGEMVIDPEDVVNHLNRFPGNVELQTFLIDRNHRVIAIGNPIMGAALERVYLSAIGGKVPNIQQMSNKEEARGFNFGKIAPGEKAMHTFRLHNSSSDTLKVRDVVTSCECTEAVISATDIPPDSYYELNTLFRDTVPGEFFRTVSILFENNIPAILFELSGEVINSK